MSFFTFGPNDIVHTKIVTNPTWSVANNGYQITGSIQYDRPFLTNALANRQVQGFSERLGGLTTKFATLTASVDFLSAVKNGTNKQLYSAVQNLYNFYSIQNSNYTLSATTIRVISVPQIYYDNRIVSATFTASDHDAAGANRFIYDDGNGGLFSGSLSGTLVGNIFYAEGLAVLTVANLTNFGSDTPDNFRWRTDFKGTHTIPVNIYRCRAPGGTLNASTNTSFYTVPSTGPNKSTRQILTSSLYPYITAVGMYNENYELVAVARLAQPVKKEHGWDVCINCKIDW